MMSVYLVHDGAGWQLPPHVECYTGRKPLTKSPPDRTVYPVRGLVILNRPVTRCGNR